MDLHGAWHLLLLVFCLYLFAQVVLVSVSQAERLKNAALFMIGFCRAPWQPGQCSASIGA